MNPAARDVRYTGRRGGRWTSHVPIDIDTAPRCQVCDRPMLLGQTDTHYTCRATVGEAS